MFIVGSSKAATTTARLAERSCSRCHARSTNRFRALRPYTSGESSSRSKSIPPSPQPGNSKSSTTSKRGFYIPISLLVLIPTIYYLQYDPKKPLSPYTYSDHPVTSNQSLGPQHRIVTVSLSESDAQQFSSASKGGAEGIRIPGPSGEDGGIVIYHVMVKNPDLQIERPYTPINDAEKDGQLEMVVKRVKGGEVGRHIHSRKEGEDLGIRGSLPTMSINPEKYDKIIMISSGTGVAPFLQLLSKVQSSPSSSGTKPSQTLYHLLHAQPAPGKVDWLTSLPIIPKLSTLFGDRLVVERPPLDLQNIKDGVSRAIGPRRSNERVMVLVCLPAHIMRPICGPLTLMMKQGEVTGILQELGLSSSEVWKLE